MKKNKILFLTAIFLLTIFIWSLFAKVNDVQLKNYWFGISILLIGTYTLIYYLLYGLDSSLYYGCLIFLIGNAVLCQNFLEIPTNIFYPAYILCFSLSSFAVFAIFRQKIHFNLFAILLVEVILLISYKIDYLNIWQIMIINGIYITIILIRSIFRVRKNLRRVK